MGYLSKDQLNDGNTQPATLAPGQSANVILNEYKPFQYGTNKEKTMPKHLGQDADTGEQYEFVGFDFHEAIREHNEAIIPGVTVLHIECLDNGTKYPGYAIKVVAGGATSDAAPF